MRLDRSDDSAGSADGHAHKLHVRDPDRVPGGRGRLNPRGTCLGAGCDRGLGSGKRTVERPRPPGRSLSSGRGGARNPNGITFTPGLAREWWDAWLAHPVDRRAVPAGLQPGSLVLTTNERKRVAELQAGSLPSPPPITTRSACRWFAEAAAPVPFRMPASRQRPRRPERTGARVTYRVIPDPRKPRNPSRILTARRDRASVEAVRGTRPPGHEGRFPGVERQTRQPSRT